VGLFQPSFSEKEKRQFQTRLMLPGGLLVALIGFSINSAAVGWFGILCAVVSVVTVYLEFKKKRAEKQVARKEAEIRAHQLRQARGEYGSPPTH
jgi:uncharacterized membrane protein SirB2